MQRTVVPECDSQRRAKTALRNTECFSLVFQDLFAWFKLLQALHCREEGAMLKADGVSLRMVATIEILMAFH
jgi:hypothetical protein